MVVLLCHFRGNTPIKTMKKISVTIKNYTFGWYDVSCQRKVFEICPSVIALLILLLAFHPSIRVEPSRRYSSHVIKADCTLLTCSKIVIILSMFTIHSANSFTSVVL